MNNIKTTSPMCIHGYSLATHDNTVPGPLSEEESTSSCPNTSLENATVKQYTCFKTDRDG